MDKLAKLETLRIKCLIFNEFFYEKFGYEEAYYKIKEAIEDAYKERKIRVLDALNKDNFYQMREIMPSSYLIELKKIWFEKTGENFNDFQVLIDKKIEKIKKKGIKTLDDYEIVSNEVENIWNDNNQKEKLESLNKLLIDWHVISQPTN